MASKRAHGLASRYDHGPDENDQPGKGCRCTRCGAAKSRSQKRYRLDKIRHGNRTIDAEPARRHVLELRQQAGVDLHAIARAAGVSHRVIDYLMYGVPSKGLPPARMMRRKSVEALLAVTEDDVRPGLVSVIGTQRRLRGLAVAGWPVHVISAASGICEDMLARIMRASPDSKVRVSTAERVAAGCRVLAMRDPSTHGVPRGTVTRLRTVSLAKKWVPLVAWDDLDDPRAIPDLGEKASRQAVDA